MTACQALALGLAVLFLAFVVSVVRYPFLLRKTKTTDEAGRFDDESL